MASHIDTRNILDTINNVADRPFDIKISTWDGNYIGNPDSDTEINFESPQGLGHLLLAPGELGFARAFINGDITIKGDIYKALDARYAFHDRIMTKDMIAML